MSWSADKWANIQPGSIYHALRKLTEEGLLREVATEQERGRPAKTSYEITEKGQGEFQSLLRDGWWNPQPAPDPFMAAFSFLAAIPRGRQRPRCATGARRDGRDSQFRLVKVDHRTLR